MKSFTEHEVAVNLKRGTYTVHNINTLFCLQVIDFRLKSMLYFGSFSPASSPYFELMK